MKIIITSWLLLWFVPVGWAQPPSLSESRVGLHASKLVDNAAWSSNGRASNINSYWPLNASYQMGVSYGRSTKFTGWETGLTYMQLEGQGLGRIKLNDGSEPELPMQIQAQLYMIPLLAKIGLPFRNLRIEAEAGFNILVASSFRHDFYSPPNQGPSSLLASEQQHFVGIDYISRAGIGLYYQLPRQMVLGVKSGVLIFPGSVPRMVYAFETNIGYRL
ncbi:MAG: hypothetical protein Q8J69_09905 [Sphingobacteriaceae bacterium]|nr:hypothetical protein [Sphingobacteriaceae bacterium]